MAVQRNACDGRELLVERPRDRGDRVVVRVERDVEAGEEPLEVPEGEDPHRAVEARAAAVAGRKARREGGHLGDV